MVRPYNRLYSKWPFDYAEFDRRPRVFVINLLNLLSLLRGLLIKASVETCLWSAFMVWSSTDVRTFE